MVFKAICSADDIWEGEFQDFEVDEREVIVVHAEDNGFRVFDAKCPHQDQSLAEASLEGNVLTCPAHLWQFDVATGDGVNPTGCKLTSYPCKVVDGQVMADLEAATEASQ
ncbi:2Fe-2S ferredoxin [Pusillimonas caeni]|uniref:Rieske 2Fe-2S domain-containing protein n=1 Tax=Pusillimonas caeni TaxID=1348472 RepID=UPI000E599266|nr:Rieske 2Fe-2S domain-containing protein [Pusillimonas caeni]TFL13443.1 2Fe-2S ferredoxin [Pusillimonas caeni]